MSAIGEGKMSSTLVWKPVDSPRGHFNNELKRAIGSYKFGGDGSCWDGSVIVDDDDIGFLKGLLHAGIKEAEELIDLIDSHDQIELQLEY